MQAAGLKLVSAKVRRDFMEPLFVLLKWTGRRPEFHQCPDIRKMCYWSWMLWIFLILGAMAVSWKGGWDVLLVRIW